VLRRVLERHHPVGLEVRQPQGRASLVRYYWLSGYVMADPDAIGSVMLGWRRRRG